MYRVLVVEDEEMIRKGIIYTFNWIESDCVVVGEACDGRQGIEKIRELEPDIVITDLTMPVMGGLEMLEQTIDRVDCAAIVITAYDEFDFAKKAIQMGVVEYLLKPLNHKELKEALESAKLAQEQKKAYTLSQQRMNEKKEMLVLDPVSYGSITSKKVLRMIEYLEQNYKKKISIQDLVEEIGMSAASLNQKFKKETAYTFNDFLNRYRIQKAIELIQADELKIYYIAWEVGFKDYRYFITVFKKYTSCLPSDFYQRSE